jgi:selenide,water dikinase
VIAKDPSAAARPLTSMARGAGCGCKLAPGLLARALALVPTPPDDPDILVGHATLDDAAVHRLRDDLALVASVDFFTPIVDDPGTFGAIAATNALSDLHAMGATPLLALAVACYPRDADPEVLGAVMAGGARAAAAEGCPVLGGHTVDDPEPKYGLAVLGTAHPERLMTNAAGSPGDVLVLTKPLGVGIAVAAARAGEPGALAAAVASMLRSNRPASEAALACGVRCATDVTGFGLLGHLRELAAASGLAAELQATRAPVLDGVLALAASGHAPGGAGRNREFLETWLEVEADVAEALLTVLVDPQTSGGLLLAIPPERHRELGEALAAAGTDASEVGRLVAGPAGRIRVRGGTRG